MIGNPRHLGATYVGNFDWGTVYQAGDVVWDGGGLFIALDRSQGVDPSDSSGISWEPFDPAVGPGGIRLGEKVRARRQIGQLYSSVPRPADVIPRIRTDNNSPISAFPVKRSMSIMPDGSQLPISNGTLPAVLQTKYALFYGGAGVQLQNWPFDATMPVVTTENADTVNAMPAFMEVISDAPVIGFEGNIGGIEMLEVDGQLLHPVDSPPPSGGNRILIVNWGTERRLRRYRLNGIITVSAIHVSAQDTLYPPAPDGVRAAWLTDSFGQGGGSLIAFPQLASLLLGWDRPMVSAEGGTGFVYRGAGGNMKNFEERLPKLLNGKPDVLVLAGGVNDPVAGTLVRDAIVRMVQSARAALGADLPVFILGEWNQAGQTGTASRIAQMAEAAALTSSTWIPDATTWLAGTGRIDAPVGDGNSDFYRSPDGFHPSHPAGKRYLAARIADAIRSRLPY